MVRLARRPLSDNSAEEEYVFALLSSEVMGNWDWVVHLVVVTSAIASTQTTIIPASHTGLSMARPAALSRRFAHIHPRFRPPDVSTWWVAIIEIAWYVVVSTISENALVREIAVGSEGARVMSIVLGYDERPVLCVPAFSQPRARDRFPHRRSRKVMAPSVR